MDQMSEQLFIARRILLTVAYTEQFDFPLSKKEVLTRLLSKQLIDSDSYLKAFKNLLKDGLLEEVRGYYFISGLSNKKMLELVKMREGRKKISVNKWKEANEFVLLSKRIPFISGIAVTGSLAVDNTVKDDDIDFMIVTPSKRLWLTRLLIIFLASRKGKRRSFANEEKNSWCFNLWVEESDLQLPVSSRSVYEAYEVIQAKWLFSRGGVANNFRFLNKWISKYVVNDNYDFSFIDEKKSLWWSLPILSQFFDVLNYLAFVFQYLYMKRHMTRERVSLSHAFFHPRDTKSEVFSNWKKTLLRLLWLNI